MMDLVGADGGRDALGPVERCDRDLTGNLFDHVVMGERRPERHVGRKRRRQVGRDDEWRDVGVKRPETSTEPAHESSLLHDTQTTAGSALCRLPACRRLAGGDDRAVYALQVPVGST